MPWLRQMQAGGEDERDAPELDGRGERIRTSGLLVPNQALYQAEPRPDGVHLPGYNGHRWQRHLRSARYTIIL